MKPWHPSGVTIWSITLGVTLLFVALFFAGYVPLQKAPDHRHAAKRASKGKRCRAWK